MPFLLPNQQHQSTEETTTTTRAEWPLAYPDRPRKQAIKWLKSGFSLLVLRILAEYKWKKLWSYL